MIGAAQVKRLLVAGATVLFGLLLTESGAFADNSLAAKASFQNSARKVAMSEVSVSDLPSEAQRTLELIKKGGPFPYARDGITFGNRENMLPRQRRGYYHEYTVPTPNATNRGKRRIIVGMQGEYYYTDDHYRSFSQIRDI
jgi:ribonuclease T1